jgi:hypothetical protein
MVYSNATIRAVEGLLAQGEAPRATLDELAAGLELGLWAHSADEKRSVASAALVELLAALPTIEEARAAVFACEKEIRRAWQKIIAARLKESGSRRDAQQLIEAITTLDAASGALLDDLPHASLAQTEFSELEFALFGATADNAVTTPKLFRAIGATSSLVEAKKTYAATTLADVDALDASVNWVRNRVMRLPDLQSPAPVGPASILSGSVAPLNESEQVADDNEALAVMRWALARPWVFLMAQIVFAQEAWAAERISGGLSLEIEDSQIARFYLPAQVNVVVTRPDVRGGDEVFCGTLGEFVLRVLSSLGISILGSRITAARLDDLLSPIIKELIDRKVWRFNYGSSRQRPGYSIHERFSDSCYRALGSKYFYRRGSLITGTIRNVCENWAEEQFARARRTITAEVGA